MVDIPKDRYKNMNSRSSNSPGNFIDVKSTVSPSIFRNRTINGLSVGERRCEPPVTAVGFSSCPEGVAVNVVVTGHRNGMVSLVTSRWSQGREKGWQCKTKSTPSSSISYQSLDKIGHLFVTLFQPTPLITLILASYSFTLQRTATLYYLSFSEFQHFTQVFCQLCQSESVKYIYCMCNISQFEVI